MVAGRRNNIFWEKTWVCLRYSGPNNATTDQVLLGDSWVEKLVRSAFVPALQLGGGTCIRAKFLRVLTGYSGPQWSCLAGSASAPSRIATSTESFFRRLGAARTSWSTHWHSRRISLMVCTVRRNGVARRGGDMIQECISFTRRPHAGIGILGCTLSRLRIFVHIIPSFSSRE